MFSYQNRHFENKSKQKLDIKWLTLDLYNKAF